MLHKAWKACQWQTLYLIRPIFNYAVNTMPEVFVFCNICELWQLNRKCRTCKKSRLWQNALAYFADLSTTTKKVFYCWLQVDLQRLLDESRFQCYEAFSSSSLTPKTNRLGCWYIEIVYLYVFVPQPTQVEHLSNCSFVQVGSSGHIHNTSKSS
jgi:hypothetical protein